MKKVIFLSFVFYMNLVTVKAQTWQLVGTQGFTPPVAQYSLTSLTIDHNGSPYVAFSDASDSDKVSVMKFNGSSWVFVGSADFSVGGGYDMSLAIDNNNLPWVAFGDAGNGSHATVVKFNGSNWVNVGPAGFSDGVVNNCTIKFDSNDTPFVAYVDNYYSEKVVVKKFNGSSWVNVGTPGFTGGAAGQMTMTLNRNGVPYVGYQDQANGFGESAMMYNGTSWVHVGASTFSNGTCQFTHITFDTSGLTPYVCYNEGYGPFAPNVQLFNGSSWQYVGGQNLNTDGDYQNNLAIDGNNTPYVIFPDGHYGNGQATVEKYNGSSWVTAGNAGFSSGEIWYPNIAVDQWNNVYVEYYDDGDADKISVLKLGNFGPPSVIAKFSASDSVLCQNSSVSFTDQSVGSPTKWSWTFSGGTPPVSNSQNPTVSYDSAGVFDVKLVITTTGGMDSLTKTAYITVIAAGKSGTISATPDTVCSGDSVHLNTAGSLGNLQWQSSASNSNFQNISGATDSSYVISPATGSIYFRLVAVNQTCPDTSTEQIITVHPLPSPPVLTANDSLICSSDSALIQASGPYSSYKWSTGDTGTYIYAKSGGGYWVSVTDVNGCRAVSGHQNITVYPVPSVSITVQGDTLASFGQMMYQWLLNGDTIPGSTGAFYVANKAGSYSVQVTDSNGCTATSNAVIVSGIEELPEENVSLYPNPTVSGWQLTVSSNLIGSTLEMYDEQGNIVFRSEIQNSKSELKVSALSAGVYYLRISNDKMSVVRKMVKL